VVHAIASSDIRIAPAPSAIAPFPETARIGQKSSAGISWFSENASPSADPPKSGASHSPAVVPRLCQATSNVHRLNSGSPPQPGIDPAVGQ